MAKRYGNDQRSFPLSRANEDAGEEEPPHEVKAYQPDTLTEYGERRRRKEDRR